MNDTQSKLLSVEDIRSAKDIEMRRVEVPAWGGHVYIKQLSRAQQDEYFRRQFGASTVRSSKGKDAEVGSISMYGHDAWLCVMGCVDEAGNQIFSSKDEKMLREKNGAVVGQLAKEIVEFSDMSEDIEAIEAEAKN